MKVDFNSDEWETLLYVVRLLEEFDHGDEQMVTDYRNLLAKILKIDERLKKAPPKRLRGLSEQEFYDDWC